MHARKLLWAALAALLVVTLFAALPVLADSPQPPDTPGAPSGDGITPVYYDGWQSGNAAAECGFLGFDTGYKVDAAAPTGTYPLDGINTVAISNSDGYLFDWSATLPLDAVIVKGGNGANVYFYVPEDTADTRLHPPVAPNGSIRQVSHVTFCFDYELAASKTAVAGYTRTYRWTIAKSVDPTLHSGAPGDAFSSAYQVVVDQTTTDSDWHVAGAITVRNPTPFPTGFTIHDTVNGNVAVVDCPADELQPGQQVVCSYRADLTGPNDGTNTATITSLNPNVAGTTARQDYAFGDPTTVVGPATVHVSDSVQGPLGTANGDKTFTYNDDFLCPTDRSLYVDGRYSYKVPNIAQIDETGQTANASVEVVCKEEEANYCPIDHPNVGPRLTTLVGRGMGGTTAAMTTAEQPVAPGALAKLYGQLAAIDNGVMTAVKFSHDGTLLVKLTAATSEGYRRWSVDWWGANLPSHDSITGTFVPGSGAALTPRALVLWPTYTMTDEYANVFKTFRVSRRNHVYWQWIPVQTQKITIPATQAPGADLLVRVALVDNQADNRPVVLRVTAGGVSRELVLFGPNVPGLGPLFQDTLNLEEIRLNDVPAGTSQVTLRLLSPGANDPVYGTGAAGGDSVAMIGAAISYPCAPVTDK